MNGKGVTGWQAYLLLLASGGIWGASFSLSRIATSTGNHPVGLTLWQAIIGAIVLLVVAIIRQVWPRTSVKQILRYIAIALLGTVIPSTLYYYAAQKLPVGILSITVALVPILTYGAALLLRSDQFSLKRFFGVVCAFIGIALLMHPDALPDKSMLPWVLVALLCAGCYTAENIFVDVLLPVDEDMCCFLLGGMVVAIFILLPLTLVTDTWVSIVWPLDKIDWAIIGMGLITAGAYLAFLLIIQSCGAVFASMMAYIVTVAGVGWGMWIFAEQHSLLIWVVLGLLMLGVGLVKPIDKSAN